MLLNYLIRPNFVDMSFLYMIFETYSLASAIIHLALAFIFFFYINWVGSYAKPLGYMQLSVIEKDDTYPMFNLLFKVLAPVVMMVIVGAVCQKAQWSIVTTNMYFIVVDYWIVRVSYIVAFSKATLTDWKIQIIYIVTSVLLSIFIYYSILSNVDSILPSAESLRDQLWICIILFLYSILNKLEVSRDSTILRKERYIKEKYSSFQKKYSCIVNVRCPNMYFRILLYSLMIYENFNRPPLARKVEHLYSFFSKKKHTYGIMQVTHDGYIDDETSVMLAIEKIKCDYESIVIDDDVRLLNIIGLIVAKYNGGEQYNEEVEGIFRKIFEWEFPTVYIWDIGAKDLQWDCIVKDC